MIFVIIENKLHHTVMIITQYAFLSLQKNSDRQNIFLTNKRSLIPDIFGRAEYSPYL
ncbi:MAG: hypothetical protein F6K48_04095 [Okeania sp. SIO3H1]|nr:hypothetical protein [Okeania sp. SIO3H1]